MADLVGPEGSRSARIVLIGEAPGHWEHVYGKPFVGPSYTDKLKPWWAAAGLERGMFYITNVLQYQPKYMDAVPEAEMRLAFDRLHSELSSLDDPWLIVPTGNYALYALTGKGRVSFHNRDGRWERPGITSWRGSILSYEDRRGRIVKVIPTVHPASTFKTPQRSWVCERDWQRIAGDLQFRELRLPERTHLISPSIGEVREYAKWTRSTARTQKAGERLICSLDVETPNKVEYATKEGESKSQAPGTKCRMCGHTLRWHNERGPEDRWCAGPRGKGCALHCQGFAAPLLKPKRVKLSEMPYLGCVGYAWQSKLSMTVPTTLAYWKDERALAECMDILRELHADPFIDWMGQNFLFDAWWCAEEGVPLSTLRWDTMKMHRVIAPWSMWHDLAFQGSLYTRQPYWKDEAKDPDSVSKYAHNNEALWTYNGIDNGVQIELCHGHIERLRACGRLEYYNELEAPIDYDLLPLSRTGMRMDESGAAAERAAMIEQAGTLAKELNEIAGRKLVTKTAVSNKALIGYFYGADGLRLPEQYKTTKAKDGTKKKNVSVDVVSIKRLMERFPGIDALQEVGARVLQHRRKLKVAGFLEPAKLKAGRWYAVFKQDTLLGRLSSAATPKGDGANLQNIDRKLRRFFLPEASL